MLPENVGTGRVVGKFLAVRSDESEPNAIADERLRFRFTPEIGQTFLHDVAAATVLRFGLELGPGDTVPPFEAGVDDEGHLINLRTMERHMPLVATDDPDIGVTGWTWRVDFILGGKTVKTASIPVATGATVDLATAIPQPPSPGDDVADWLAAVALAQAAAADAVDARDEAVQAAADVANITSATATTLAPGSLATVEFGPVVDRERGIFFGIPEGAKGDKGDRGDAGTIAAVSADTLAPGSAATVTADGTPSDRILTFGIPRGAPGAKGDQGLPGLDAVPTGEGIATHLSTSGPAKTALDAAIAAPVDAALAAYLAAVA